MWLVIRRIALLLWCLTCLAVAVESSLQMLVTFAPNPRLARDLGKSEHQRLVERSELHGIEQVRNFWAGSVFMASGLLVINSMLLVIQSWGVLGKPENQASLNQVRSSSRE